MKMSFFLLQVVPTFTVPYHTLDTLGTTKPKPRPRKVRLHINVRPVTGGSSNPNTTQNHPRDNPLPASAIPHGAKPHPSDIDAPLAAETVSTMATSVLPPSTAGTGSLYHHVTRTPTFSAPVLYRTGRVGAGQGKAASTILGDQGDFVTVISELPYTDRAKRRVWSDRPVKGTRPMHKTSLVIPTQDYTDYNTTNQRVHAASRTLEPDEIPHTYPSQHRSEIRYDHRGQEGHMPWHSHYKNTFYTKPTDVPHRLHYPTFENKLKNTHGNDVKDMIQVVDLPQPYVSQYTRIHDKLGVLLGPGIHRQQPMRRQYNILTGEDVGAAWQAENRRISGNRVLYNSHRRDCNFVLG